MRKDTHRDILIGEYDSSLSRYILISIRYSHFIDVNIFKSRIEAHRNCLMLHFFELYIFIFENSHINQLVTRKEYHYID
jgi:hypothetical protein